MLNIELFESRLKGKTEKELNVIHEYLTIRKDVFHEDVTEQLEVVNRLLTKLNEPKEDENDFSELTNSVNGLYPTGVIRRCIWYLDKKNVGKVTRAELTLKNGELEGYVYGTNGNYRLWQSVRVSPKGVQHFKMNVSRM